MKLLRIFKNFLLVVTGLVAVTALQSCHDEPEVKPEKVERAVLVYMVSNNSLYGCDEGDIREMIMACQQGDFGGNRLIVYQAARNSVPKLLEITDKGAKELKVYDEATLSVTIEQMRTVITDFKRVAPAERIGIILWSHACGWLQNGISDPYDWQLPSVKSFGDDGGRYMNITALSCALDGEGFDFVYFDCCHMASVEALYQMRQCADYFIGSTTILPSEGMPYNLSLKYLMRKDADVVGAAQATFEYFNSKGGMERSSTMSVIKASALLPLAEVTAELYANSERPPVSYRPQPFIKSNNCYLFDFENYVDNFVDVDPTLAARWKSCFDDAVIYSAATPRIFNELTLNYHCGLSTYILKSPSDVTYNNYDQLSWWTDVASNIRF